jgi:hypothetical protein
MAPHKPRAALRTQRAAVGPYPLAPFSFAVPAIPHLSIFPTNAFVRS